MAVQDALESVLVLETQPRVAVGVLSLLRTTRTSALARDRR